MRRLVRRLMSAYAAALLWSGVLNAQSVTDTLPSPAMSQSLEELIARLPGQPVQLAELVSVGLRNGFPAQLALAEQQRAVGTALYEGRVLDPQLRIISALGSGARFDGTASAMNRETTIAVEGALPWGTLLSADFGRAPLLATSEAQAVGDPSRLSLTVAQPLLEGFNQRAVPLRAAQLERSAADLQLRRVHQEIAFDIEVQYWLLAEAQAVEAVFSRSLELANEILSRNVELASRDLIASVDVLTVQSGVALRESFHEQARQARYDQSDALLFAAYGEQAAALVQSDSVPALAVDQVVLPVEQPTGTDAERSALLNRTDLRAAQTLRDASRLLVSQARNSVLPNLALEGGYSAYRGTAGSIPPGIGPQGQWRLGVSFGTPLFNRGDRGLSVLANTQLEIESIRVSSREAQIIREVREAVRAVRLGTRRWESASRAAALAWEQLIAERRRLELGLGDSFRLLQTEDNAVQSQLEAVRARYDLLRALARYRLATGIAQGAP